MAYLDTVGYPLAVRIAAQKHSFTALREALVRPSSPCRNTRRTVFCIIYLPVSLFFLSYSLKSLCSPHSFVRLFIHVLNHSFINPSIHPSIYPSVHVFIHSLKARFGSVCGLSGIPPHSPPLVLLPEAWVPAVFFSRRVIQCTHPHG